MVDFDVQLIVVDSNGCVCGDEDWAVDGFVQRAALVDFADAHGDSATNAAEGGFAFFGNEGAGVECQDAV